MKKILLLIVAGLLMALVSCSEAIPEETKTKGKKLLLTNYLQNNDNNNNNGSGNQPPEGAVSSPDYGLTPPGAGTILPDWAIGDMSTIIVKREGNGDVFYDIGSGLMANLNYDDYSSAWGWFYNALEYNDDYGIKIYETTDDGSTWTWSVNIYGDSSNGASDILLHDDDRYSVNIPQSSLDTMKDPDGPAKRVSLLICVVNRAEDSQSPSHEYYVWKGFVNGYGTIDVQLVGYYGFHDDVPAYQAGDQEVDTPYTPIKP